MRKSTILTVFLLLGLLFLLPLKKEGEGEFVKIKVCKVVEHEAINSVVAGLCDYLKGLERLQQSGEKYNISIETCQGNVAIASQIIAKFVDAKADVIVTVGTIPSQAAYKYAKTGKAKVVFSSVTNPEDISSDLQGKNITGVSNFIDLLPQLELFKKIQPNLKSLGIIYNTSEANSFFIVKKLRTICDQLSIKLVEQGISKVSELPQATEKLSISADAVFISNDNMALSGMNNIISICSKKNVPVYVSDTDQVEKGCTAALGPNQYDIGIQTGKIVERIVSGEDINRIAIQYPETTELFVNTKSVIKIPDEVVSEAKVAF